MFIKKIYYTLKTRGFQKYIAYNHGEGFQPIYTSLTSY